MNNVNSKATKTNTTLNHLVRVSQKVQRGQYRRDGYREGITRADVKNAEPALSILLECGHIREHHGRLFIADVTKLPPADCVR